MPGTTHTDRVYENELAELRQKLLAMGGRVERAIGLAVEALVKRDRALAEKVQADDREVNRAEIDIDEQCRRMLALRQPAASDLRFITTALKIVVDLERMGDLCVNIAQRVIDLADSPHMRPYVDMPRLGEMAQAQLKAALDAFVSQSAERAEDVLKQEDLVDALYQRVFNETLQFMMEDVKHIRGGTQLMLVSKYLERFADHAGNVAEMVIFMVRGTDVRHPRSRGID